MALLLCEHFYIDIKQVVFTKRISARYSTCDCTVFQSGLVREAAWKSDWAGSPVSHQRSINVLMTVSEEFTLTAGKIFPVSRRTMLKVRNLNVAEAVVQLIVSVVSFFFQATLGFSPMDFKIY